MLTRGSIPLGYQTNGAPDRRSSESSQRPKSATFVAHFEHDGNYAGAVRLDLPFQTWRAGRVLKMAIS